MAGTASKEYKLAVEIGGKVNRSLQSAIGTATGALQKIGSVAGGAMKVAAGAVAAGTAATVGFATEAVNAGMSFDKSMSQVAATMGTSVDQIGQLRDFAMEMGAKTAFSATEAADALNYMALAGYDADTSMAMLPNVLNLAAAGGIELADASDMITDAQSALGLNIEQTTAMVDQMAKASSKTNTSVAQLGEAILTVGGTAQYMAGGTNELSSVLGVLADNGIKGSEGGTHLRNILLKLASPTKEASDLLNQLGVNVFDAQGKMRSFSELFPELNAAMSTLTDEERLSAMSTLFNSRDIASATALLSTSTERWGELSDQLDNCTGAAQAMADTQLDNLAGDITLWKSALEGAYITISDELNPTLRQFVQFGTHAVSTLQDAFKEGGLDGAMEALGTLLSEGLNMVISGLPGMIDAGMQLLGALGQGLIQNIPTITNAGVQIVMALADGLISAIPSIGKGAVQLITSLMTALEENAGQIIGIGAELINTIFEGIITGLPILAQGAVEIMGKLAQYIRENLPTMIQTGLDMLVELSASLRENAGILIDGALDLVLALAQGIAEAIPALIEDIPTIISNIAGIINDNAPKLIETGIQIIVTLAAGIVKAIPTLIANIPKILKAIWDALTAVNWVSLGKTIIKGIGSGLTGIGGFVKKAFGSVKETVLQNFRNLPQTLATVGQNALTALSGAFRALPGALKSILPQLGTSILSALKSLPGMLSGLFSQAWEAIKTVFAPVGQWASGVWQSISGAFQSVASWFGGIFSQAWGAITGAFTAVGQWASGIWESIKTGFFGIGEWFGSTFSSAWESLKMPFTTAAEWASGVWESIKSGFGSVASWFGGTFADAWAAVKGVFSTGGEIFAGITEGISSGFRTVVNGIIGGLNSVIQVPFGAINDALDTIRGIEIMGLNPFSWLPSINTPQIPLLAGGGVVDQATLLEAGEAGPEAIIPLDDFWNTLNDFFDSREAGERQSIGTILKDFLGIAPAQPAGAIGETPAGQGVSYQITYSPQYTITGGTIGKQEIVEAERTSQAEFDRQMKLWMKNERRYAFG